MIPLPTLHVAAVLPVLFLAVGAFAVLLAELFLNSRGTGKSGAGSVLVALSGITLLAVVVIAAQGFPWIRATSGSRGASAQTPRSRHDP